MDKKNICGSFGIGCKVGGGVKSGPRVNLAIHSYICVLTFIEKLFVRRFFNAIIESTIFVQKPLQFPSDLLLEWNPRPVKPVSLQKIQNEYKMYY